jgi:hypothetical protein
VAAGRTPWHPGTRANLRASDGQARLGESTEVISALKRAIAKGYADDGWLKYDPDLNALRAHPDFVALMAAR